MALNAPLDPGVQAESYIITRKERPGRIKRATGPESFLLMGETSANYRGARSTFGIGRSQTK